jgi:hypothetical protein
VVRIIDEATKVIASELSNSGLNSQGHVSSILSVKWYDATTLISGGWDRNLNFWDTRSLCEEASFLVPNVCGD